MVTGSACFPMSLYTLSENFCSSVAETPLQHARNKGGLEQILVLNVQYELA
jgi:hypothetical protein